jgi:hypothetical protein
VGLQLMVDVHFQFIPEKIDMIITEDEETIKISLCWISTGVYNSTLEGG